MNTPPRSLYLLASRKYFFWLGVFFMIIFSIGVFYTQDVIPSGNSSTYNYYVKYGNYIPLVVGILSIVLSYILLFILFVIRLHYLIAKIFIYLIIYGFWLVLAIQLRYLEPRYTEIARILIDAYALPMLIASSAIIGCVILLSFVRKNPNSGK